MPRPLQSAEIRVAKPGLHCEEGHAAHVIRQAPRDRILFLPADWMRRVRGPAQHRDEPRDEVEPRIALGVAISTRRAMQDRACDFERSVHGGRTDPLGEPRLDERAEGFSSCALHTRGLTCLKCRLSPARIIIMGAEGKEEGISPMKLITVMQHLYRSGINCGMKSFYDAGFKVWLGDEANGIKAEQEFSVDELDRAAGAWLDEAARKHYPDSLYARAR